MRILVVDDSAGVRRRIADQLRDIDGVSLVAEAADARTAVYLARTIKPNWVVLDLNLPGQSGLDILPQLKGGAPPPRVLVLTNHAGEAYARRCQHLGADYFFDKSKQFQTAIEVVRSSVSAGPARLR